uniref:Transmembrane protein 256 n=1 Tax=Eptatretus burgeri TaxID=7764 RepID=A0A8C4QEB2_EPTBU
MASGRFFIRVAGLSGALAVSAGAYVRWWLKKRKRWTFVYTTANRYHYIHTLALLGVPHCRHPLMAGSLLTAGMVFFCGSCYAHALLENGNVRSVTPFGGMCLIAGWLTMIL